MLATWQFNGITAPPAPASLELKVSIEQMREQVQNLE